jgi:hypothetical protein
LTESTRRAANVSIVKANVDLIVCAGDPCVRAAQEATKTLPILAIAERHKAGPME